jgi:hypothetical protein
VLLSFQRKNSVPGAPVSPIEYDDDDYSPPGYSLPSSSSPGGTLFRSEAIFAKTELMFDRTRVASREEEIEK